MELETQKNNSDDKSDLKRRLDKIKSAEKDQRKWKQTA